MKPIIGIFAEVDSERSTTIQDQYVRAITAAGAIPIVLPYTNEEHLQEELVDLCNGFLFSGGADVDPGRYGEERTAACEEPQLYRDEFEFAMFQKAFSSGKPMLAICRGAQLINVALGGKLYQDLPSENPTQIDHRQSEPKFAPSHRVSIVSGTPLAQLVGDGYMTANSFHHQAVKALGRGLKVMAYADDGIIEAMYYAGKPYIRAYQWHPERICDEDGQNRLIFDDFVAACKIQNA
ncbi:MAG: gamma-glutamyl-gamma-aminobutyrate hydrolase family protein [Clostridia bacterium]|nr:gamma-glutamyl-gamma-aminobutyrate hydrolase family protein [Clostridia bacterium]